MNKWQLIALCASLAVAATARADDPAGDYFDGTPIDCPGASSEVQYNDCAYRMLQKSDKQLNALYRRLTAAADDEEKRYLKSMQQAWGQLRDAQCGLMVVYHAGAANLDAWKTRCEAVMTVRRVHELEMLGTGILWKHEAAR
jgi:uncharacterized protein YecT (DUF1311 family)